MPRLKSLTPLLPLAITPLVLAMCWLAISHLAAEVRPAELQTTLAATPAWAIAAAFALTAIGFSALIAYDLGAFAYIGRQLPLPVVALGSFCAYAVGNTAGFGPLTAGAIRYRFYTPHGLAPDELARIIAFVTAAFGIGVTGVAGLGLLLSPHAFPSLPLSPRVLQAIGAAIGLMLVALLLTAQRGRPMRLASHTIALPRAGVVLRQYLASLIDITAAAGVLWVLLPEGGPSFPAFVALYAVAVALGVISHVPAGLGVFETVIITALAPTMPIEGVLGALVLYRVIYHLVPLVLAVLVLALSEARRAASHPALSPLLQSGTRIAPVALSALTLVTGAVLMFSSVTPAAPEALAALKRILPLPLVESAHFLSSVLGALLVIIARGLVGRLDGAWWAAVASVSLAMLLAPAKALALWEMTLLAMLLLALLATRRQFTRHASLLHQTRSTGWVLAMLVLVVATVGLLFFMHREVAYSHALWWQFEFSRETPRGLRAMVGILMTAGLTAAWTLLRPVPHRPYAPSSEELARARSIVRGQERADSGLVGLGDKALRFSEDGRAFVMYGVQGRSWIALGDPVGPRECWPELIWRFVEDARAAGGRAAFYQVSAEALSLYADAGLRAFKLGEEARVNLADFDLHSSKRANLRGALNRMERAGLRFELLPAGQAPMETLRAISDAWLMQHHAREKRFSLGAFEPAYIAAQPIAVLYLAERIVAFASVLDTDLTEEASIDLMRFHPDAPNGAMEALFVHLMLHFKAHDYRWFSLGMAPLSGLSDSHAAPVWHKVGRIVFEHGERFYNFAGLRAFKSKFQPHWQPRYLAVSGGIDPLLVLADTTLLIGGSLKGVLGK